MLTSESQIALYLTVFLSCTSFSIVMPTLWPYLHAIHGTPFDLALVVASYSVGEASGALLFGHLAKSMATRQAMVLSMVCGVLGSFLYVYPSRACILLGRVLHGIWTGASQAVQQVYLADVLQHDELTPAVVMLNAFASLGFVFGPAFGFVISMAVPKDLVARRYMMSGVNMDVNVVAPGFAVLVSAVTCVGLYAWVFDEDRDRGSVSEDRGEVWRWDDEQQTMNANEGGQKQDGNSYIAIAEDTLGSGTHSGYDTQTKGEEIPLLADVDSRPMNAPPNRAWTGGYSVGALVFCNVVFFVHFYGFAIQETVTTPFVQNLYGWTVREANALFTFSGILALLSFGVLRYCSSRCPDEWFLLASFVMGAVGHGMIAVMRGSDAFLVGFSLLSVAFPIGRATCVALYTKLLPKRMQHTGQGVLLAVGAVARIIGPFPAALAADPGGRPLGTTAVFGTAAMGLAMCAAWQTASFGNA